MILCVVSVRHMPRFFKIASMSLKSSSEPVARGVVAGRAAGREPWLSEGAEDAGATASRRAARAAALRSFRSPPPRRSTARVVMNSSQATPSTPKPADAVGLKAVSASQPTTPVITRPTGTSEAPGRRCGRRRGTACG